MTEESDATPYLPTDRRPLKSRSWKFSQAAATFLVRKGVSANCISVLGMVAGILAGSLLYSTPAAASDGPLVARAFWLLAGVLIQLRLLANLLDGMVAIESGRASPVGELYNEIPDRVSDAAILIGAGYATGGNAAAGYVAALLAVTTAYIRAVGKAATGKNDYCGPFAKPQRMALMTGLCLFMALTPAGWQTVAAGSWSLGVTTVVLAVIAVGSFVTCVRRLVRIARLLAGGQS